MVPHSAYYDDTMDTLALGSPIQIQRPRSRVRGRQSLHDGKHDRLSNDDDLPYNQIHLADIRFLRHQTAFQK